MDAFNSINTDSLLNILANTFPEKIIGIINKSSYKGIGIKEFYTRSISSNLNAGLAGIIVHHENEHAVQPLYASENTNSFLPIDILESLIPPWYDVVIVERGSDSNLVNNPKEYISLLQADDLPYYSVSGKNIGRINLFTKDFKDDYLTFLRDKSYGGRITFFESISGLLFQEWFDKKSRFSNDITELKEKHAMSNYPVYEFTSLAQEGGVGSSIQQGRQGIIYPAGTIITPIYNAELTDNKNMSLP
jgi:hypothetical protein